MDGRTQMVVIIKELYSIGVNHRLTRCGGAEVHTVDEPWDEDAPDVSSIKIPSDICLRKPSTDVIVVGAAVAPGRAPVTELNVLVRVGPVEKSLRCYGTRVWYQGAAGLTLTPPEPFEALPLRWEYAFGGFDASDPDAPPKTEARNPVGCGVARKAGSLIHQQGPQIEDPEFPIDSPGYSGPPAGIGAIQRHWEPRLRYAGTYDDLWMQERMPLMPMDFDERFNQVAEPALVTPTYLRGGELVELHNLSHDGPIRFRLPKLNFYVGASIRGEVQHFSPVLDTLILRPSDDRTVELTWRAAVPMPRRSRHCDWIQVHERAWV
jgi:hypothetical protein